MNLNEYLSKISFKSNISSLEDYYVVFSQELDLAKEIGYHRENVPYKRQDRIIDNDDKPFYTGLFHFSLSVKVFSTSKFIPFKFIDFNNPDGSDYNPNDDIIEIANKYANELIMGQYVNYNYADFLTEVSSRIPQVSSIEFDVEKDATGIIRIFHNKLYPYGADQRLLSNDLKVSDYSKLLAPDSFVSLFSHVYLEQMGLNCKLRFSLYAFDSDSDDETMKLTHFIIISPNPLENEAFFYNKVRKIRDIASRIRTKHIQNLIQKTRFEAIKSAISAIMSRNMSHNLGSHYMYYTKAYLEQLANSVNDIAPDIRGAAKVLGYVQARMDYLATVISNDKYPYGAVNFKSQIYDELTVDDFSHRHFREDKNKRTTNFLLTNLILSENFTRPDVRSDEDISSNSNQLFLHVKLLKEDNHYVDFTGTWHSSKLKWFKDRRRKNPNLPTLTSEEDIKNQLSSLNIALPGGSMSCHALFNVVENFIRNSAKYLQNDINKEEGLICTLAIAPNPDNPSLIDITIYDNKKNANKIVDISRNLTLYELIICKLESLVIIDDQDKISKDNKGFKEMLFSSIWMRAYTFGNDKTYADIVSEINNVSCGESKIELIERYGFSLVRVQETSDGGISINNRKMPLGGECNLGLTITLPVFKQCDTILLSGVKSVDVNNILNIMADIVEVDKEFFKSVYHHVFTRPLLKDVAAGMSIYEKYHKVVTDRFPDIDKYALSLEKAEDHYNSTPKEFQIFFKRHMSTAGNADPCEYEGYAYADTISGGNFTITLLDLFKKGYENGVYKSDDDRIFALKIKESALTRITVIDERLFNSTEKKDYPWLSLKNVRVLNYDDSFDESLKEDASDDEGCISSIFVGNSFGDGRDKTHFLTIHLGLIEKILKNSKFVNTLINKGLENEAGCGTYNPLDPIRVRTFMKLLRMHYSEGVQRDIYIAIHSGRGNYSAELEGPLSKYPFISLSALENAFNNSKYQLSQLLYNTVYIGKGFANNI